MERHCRSERVTMMAQGGNGWCVLRTSGRTTLKLAETLAKDGFEVWTPIETRVIRIPRANVRRTVTLPILPSYVFARAGHLIDLLNMARMPVKPRRGAGRTEPAHCDFSVMRCFNKIPIISEDQLDRLRALEVKLTPRKKAERTIPIGHEVRVEHGSFGGMTGTVQRSDRAFTLVCFSEKYVVKISTSLLLPEDISIDQPAALKAA